MEYISYKDIKHNFKSSWDIPYEILLRTVEWRNLRKTIISRDKNKCTVCGNEESEKGTSTYYRKPTEEEIAENLKTTPVDFSGDGSYFVNMKNAPLIGVPIDNPVILHVHHKHYIFGNLPWEYKAEVLTTVCHSCHLTIHKSEQIPVFVSEDLKEKLDLTPCSRCCGTGFLEEFHYFQNGICFRCDGRKFDELMKK